MPALRWLMAILGLLFAAGRSSKQPLDDGAIAAALVATGSIEGEVSRPPVAAVRTAERYVSASGEPREVQRIPAVAYVQGAVTPAAAARPSGRAELLQRGEAFQPTILVVPVGAEVRFPNGDPTFHNVFSYSRPKRFDLGRYRQGEAKTVVFDRPGYIKVMCEVHKWMRAGILVVENPYYAVVSENGRFRIDGVPAGHYTVGVEQFDRRVQVEVDVPDGGSGHITAKL